MVDTSGRAAGDRVRDGRHDDDRHGCTLMTGAPSSCLPAQAGQSGHPLLLRLNLSGRTVHRHASGAWSSKTALTFGAGRAVLRRVRVDMAQHQPHVSQFWVTGRARPSASLETSTTTTARRPSTSLTNDGRRLLAAGTARVDGQVTTALPVLRHRLCAQRRHLGASGNLASGSHHLILPLRACTLFRSMRTTPTVRGFDTTAPGDADRDVSLGGSFGQVHTRHDSAPRAGQPRPEHVATPRDLSGPPAAYGDRHSPRRAPRRSSRLRPTPPDNLSASGRVRGSARRRDTSTPAKLAACS